jgi:undecaprenyl pyrophosphate synthase
MSLLQYAHWLRDNAIDRIRRVLLGVLKAGPIPRHVAFIMDGNRRYARNKGVRVIQGHVDGFVALRRVRAQTRLCTDRVTNSINKKNKIFFWTKLFQW